jgi:hypothetical protein
VWKCFCIGFLDDGELLSLMWILQIDYVHDVNTKVVTKIRKKKIRIIKRDLRELEQRGLKTVCNEK